MKRISVWAVSGLLGGLLAIGCRAETKAAPASLGDLVGSAFVNAAGETVKAEALEGKKIIALYFSAVWCPPCRAFTPRLVEAANELKADGKPFEVIFVSRDRSADAMLGYMKDYKMQWLALPFGDARIQALASRYDIRGIPALVVIDSNGNTITTNGRAAIAAQGAKAFDTWAAAAK